jgi:hypothetical protein
MKFEVGDTVVFKRYDYDIPQDDLFKIGEILKIDYVKSDCENGGILLIFRDRHAGIWDWQAEHIVDTKLNRVLYPELTSNGRGFLS